jgi:peptidoglycan/xylan/chitin deacetylase (PgdA/CDA1 family)
MFKTTLRDAAKTGLALGLAGTGLLALYSRLRTVAAGPRIHVLSFHRVVDQYDFTGETQPINPALCITTDTFRRQMRLVRDRFRVLSLDQVVSAMRGELFLDRDACAITFDDGYRDTWLRAAPVLAELRLPATVFVPTAFPGSGRYLDHDRLYACFWQATRERRSLAAAPVPPALRRTLGRAEQIARQHGAATAGEWLISEHPANELGRLADAIEAHLGGALELDAGAHVLTPVELRALSDGGWEIGAHTIGHVVLIHEPLERVRFELEQPRATIARWTGRDCRFLAWCNGLYSRALIEEARRAGYLGAVTTYDRWNRRGGDCFRMGRKTLWEAHARAPGGRYSEALACAQLHDLFGQLGLTSPQDGERESEPTEVTACAT